MNNEKVNDYLNRIGKTCFIEHYYDFKNCENKKQLAQMIYHTSSQRKINGNITRINKAKKIFNEHLEKEAIITIINSKNPRITLQTKELAKKILINERL